MKYKFLVIVLASVLTACGGATATTPAAPTNAPPATDVPVAPTEAAPTEAAPTEAAPTEAPTEAPPTTASTEAPTTTPSETATTAPAPAQPTATATSSGPLAAQIFVANCRSAPTAEKPGNVIVQISVEAMGGNGQYTYVYEGTSTTDKFIEIPWELGSRLTGLVTVNSGDGQSIEVQLNIDLKELECP